MAEKDWIFIGAVDDAGSEPRLSTRWSSREERDRLLQQRPFLRPHILIDGTSPKWGLRREDERGFRLMQPAVGLLACHLLANPGWHTVDKLVHWYDLRIARRRQNDSTKSAATVRTQIGKLRRAMAFNNKASDEYVEMRPASAGVPAAYRLHHEVLRPIVALILADHDEIVGVSGLDWGAGQHRAPLRASVADDLTVTLETHDLDEVDGRHWSLELELCSNGMHSFSARSLTLGLYVEEPGSSPQECYTPHVRFRGPNDHVEPNRPVVLSPMRRVSFRGYPDEKALAGLKGGKDAKVRLALELETQIVFLSPPSKLLRLLREIAAGVVQN